MNADTDKVRVDKWLWAARFFKTRSLAAQAVSGGRVHVNGQRVKPARALKTGDTLRISKGETEFHIVVLGLAERRGPASVAVELYRETESSVARREAQRQARRERAVSPAPHKRPDKKARRDLRRLGGR